MEETTKSADDNVVADLTKPQKSLWEAIITATPVALTVLATILAGLSSSEMTQAQYYRSLAAQQQSRAGDQWGFFQAKRIRGSMLEQTVDLLRPTGDRLSESLPKQSERLHRQLMRGQRQAEGLLKALAAAGTKAGPARESLSQAANKLLRTIRAKLTEVASLQQNIAKQLDSSATGRALAYIAEPLPLNSGANPADLAIQAVQKAIASRTPDQEIVGLLSQVHNGELQDALAKAEAQAQAFDVEIKPISKAIDDLAPFVDAVAAQANSLDALARELVDLEPEAPASLDEVRRGIAAIEHTGAAARATADEVRKDFKAARYTFKARRYEREARDNQVVAELYEVQVRLSGLSSDRHRERSKRFFYGMLTAQAGVTIASLSLAFRRKSILWSLASIAGLAAVILGSYVYLFM